MEQSIKSIKSIEISNRHPEAEQFKNHLVKQGYDASIVIDGTDSLFVSTNVETDDESYNEIKRGLWDGYCRS